MGEKVAITSKPYLSLSILGDCNDLNCQVFDRSVDGDYMLAKLMEHSWWQNPFCNSFAEKLYKTKGRVILCGDYSTDDDFNFKNSSAFYTPCYGEVWGETVKRHSSSRSKFSLDHKFLLNHDTKEFVDLDDYKAKSVDKDGWAIYPLPLLTAVGILIWFLKRFGNLVMFLRRFYYDL